MLSCLCYNWLTFYLQYIKFQFSSFPIVLLKILLREELFLLSSASINKRVSRQNVCRVMLGMWYIYYNLYIIIIYYNLYIYIIDFYKLQKLEERESDGFMAAQVVSQTLWLDRCDPDHKGAFSWEFLLQGHFRLHQSTRRRRRELLWMGNCCLRHLCLLPGDSQKCAGDGKYTTEMPLQIRTDYNLIMFSFVQTGISWLKSKRREGAHLLSSPLIKLIGFVSHSPKQTSN